MADMKESFDKIFKSVKETAGDLYEKADTQKEALKIRRNVTKKSGELKELYAELGRLIDALRPELPAENETDAEMLYALIDAKKEEITALKCELDMTLGITRCKACGRQTALDMAFCPYCGVKLADAELDGLSDDLAVTSDDISDLEGV